MCTQLNSIHHISPWPVRLSESWRSLGLVIAELGSAYFVVAASVAALRLFFALFLFLWHQTHGMNAGWNMIQEDINSVAVV